jgi:hypothetical protein
MPGIWIQGPRGARQEQGVANARSQSQLQHAWRLGSYRRTGSYRKIVKTGYKINIRIVAALAHVDVVIGMYWFFGAKLTAEDFDGTIGDDL